MSIRQSRERQKKRHGVAKNFSWSAKNKNFTDPMKYQTRLCIIFSYAMYQRIILSCIKKKLHLNLVFKKQRDLFGLNCSPSKVN